MAKSFFDFKSDIFESLTEATALERRAEREQSQADAAKAAAEADTRRRRAREARQEYRRERKRALELGESFKPGDTVHLGHGTKGGTGVTGKVTKVSGGMVHIQNDKGDTFKGPVSRATLKEFVELEEQRFSSAQLAKLKNEYGKITSVDPSQPTYKKLTSFLDRLSDEQLKQLAQAKIKFVSGLALNRVNRRKMQKESVELDEANMPKFDEVLRKGKKLGDWNMMSYFLYDGNVWMLKSGRAVNQGPLETFMKKSQSGLINSLKFEETDINEYYGRDPQGSHISHYRKGKRIDTSLEGLRRRRKEQEAKRKETEKGTKKESVELDEVSPPGFEGTVKAMKKHKEIDNPWALAWYMKNKGYKSHKTKEGKDKK